MATEYANILHQELGLEQQQRLTARQVAYMRMLEMPIDDLSAHVERELEENVALEREPDTGEQTEQAESAEPTEFADSPGQADFADAAADYDQDTIDEIEYFESERPTGRGSRGDDDRYTIDDPDMPQFRDTLIEQVREYTLTDHQRELLEYLIGSLADDGLLKKPLYVIADELEVYMGVSTTTDELQDVLHILQQFDPPGIGAQSLQETLLLQIDRRIEERPDSALWPQLRRVVDMQWNNLTSNRWHLIREELCIGEGESKALQRMLRTLTPSPGLAPGETVTSRGGTSVIVPDFIIEVGVDGTITVTLNERGLPTLRINPDYKAMALRPTAEMPGRTLQERRNTQDYLRASVIRAGAFLISMRQRHDTLLRIMREVVAAQRDYLLTGDETLVHPFMMRDVADRLGLDLSIISRVSSNKWVETPYGMRPMRWFFRMAGGVTRNDGTQLEQDRLMRAVADEIAAEDKRHPLSDEKLMQILVKKGYPIARRTVAKYREMLQIPIARMRRVC